VHDTRGPNAGGWDLYFVRRLMYLWLYFAEGQCRVTVRVLLPCIAMACKRTTKQLAEYSPSGLSTQGSTPTKLLIRNGWLGKREHIDWEWVRSGMGTCAGVARRCIHSPQALKGPPSGHPPGGCLAHPHLLDMLMYLL